MSGFSVSFNQEAPEDILAKELRELQDEQNRLYEEQRENIRRIQEKKGQIEEARIQKRRAEEIAKKEAELKAIEETYEQTRKRIEELEVESWDKAHNYQKEDIIQIFHAFKQGEKGFLNANDMGLGKTFESIAVLGLLFEENPKAKCLWLTKSTILETGGTEREIKRWSKIPVVTIKGSMNADQRNYTCEVLQDMESVIVLTNYETVRTTPALQESRYEYLVMDEVHKLKGGANQSGPTAMWKAVRDFTWDRKDDIKNPEFWEPRVDFIQMLSGTPMVNRVAEIWAYLHIFDPKRFSNLGHFERMYNVYKDLGGNINTAHILEMCLRGRMVHRKRDEVGLELPKCTVEYKFVLYNKEQQAVYDQMRTQFFIWLDEQEGTALTATAIIAQLIRLRQISVWPVFTQKRIDDRGNEYETKINVEDSAKIDEAMDIIEEAGEQVVVFCNFNEPFQEIKRRCSALGLRCELITGATKKDMDQYEVGFQQGEIDVLCINSVMGEGLNLQKNPTQWPGGSSIGIHLDRWWNSAREEQCNARLDRQGQTDPVFIYMIHSPGSVDDFVKGISDDKGELIDGVMKGDAIRPAYEWKTELKKVLG